MGSKLDYKLDKIIDEYTDKLMIFWDKCTEGVEHVLEIVKDVLTFAVGVPVLSIFFVLTFPFYCLGRMMRK